VRSMQLGEARAILADRMALDRNSGGFWPETPARRNRAAVHAWMEALDQEPAFTRTSCCWTGRESRCSR